MTDILPDVLQHHLLVVFCGTAASEKSAVVGAYYGNPSNAFWRTLYEIGLTPYLFEPQAFQQLRHYDIGLTDIAKQAVGNDDVLSDTDFDRDQLTHKMLRYQPEVLAFTSKRAYREWRGMSSSQSVSYGWQKEMIGQTRLYVLTSPSGAARGYWNIVIWQTLADHYQQLRMRHDKHD